MEKEWEKNKPPEEEDDDDEDEEEEEEWAWWAEHRFNTDALMTTSVSLLGITIAHQPPVLDTLIVPSTIFGLIDRIRILRQAAVVSNGTERSRWLRRNYYDAKSIGDMYVYNVLVMMAWILIWDTLNI